MMKMKIILCDTLYLQNLPYRLVSKILHQHLVRLRMCFISWIFLKIVIGKKFSHQHYEVVQPWIFAAFEKDETYSTLVKSWTQIGDRGKLRVMHNHGREIASASFIQWIKLTCKRKWSVKKTLFWIHWTKITGWLITRKFSWQWDLLQLWINLTSDSFLLQCLPAKGLFAQQ